jgi:hypothetical protein
MVAQPNNPDTMNSHRGREIIKRISLGPDIFPYQCTVGLRVPQSEISVWLHGIEAPRDVTSINVIAGTRPLVIGNGSDNKESRPFATHQQPVLVFREQDAGHQMLGKISPCDLQRNETANYAQYKTGTGSKKACLLLRDRREVIHTVQSGKVRKSAIEQLLVLKHVAVFRWENAEVEQCSRTR